MTNQPKALPGTAALLGYFLQDVLRGQHLADNPASYEAGRIHSLGQLTVWLQLASWAAGQMTEALSSTSFKSTSCGNQKSKCKHCGLIFRNSEIVDRHVEMEHTSAAEHRCQACNQKYRSNDDLELHMAEEHEGEADCMKCNAFFKV